MESLTDYVKKYVDSNKQRPNWDEYFMAEALMRSLRSTCPRLSVGAVIVKDNRVISGGYNGALPGMPHCLDVGCILVKGSCQRALHAEENCIIQCALTGANPKGGKLYITHMPCLRCIKLVIGAGIKEIIYLDLYKETSDLSIFLANEAGVKIHSYGQGEGEKL